MDKHPACFRDRKQFVEWVKFARMAKPHPNHSYCEDCTPQYKELMLKQDRCAFPGVTFRNTEGFRSQAEVRALKASRFAKFIMEITGK
jgi:hypothetical protein